MVAAGAAVLHWMNQVLVSTKRYPLWHLLCQLQHLWHPHLPHLALHLAHLHSFHSFYLWTPPL